MNANIVDDIVWIGLFDEDYLSDTVDDIDYQSNHSANRARPVSMISCILNKTKQFFSFSLSFVHLVPNFMSAPNNLSIMEEIDLKEKTPNRSTNHQRQSSDSTILNDNQMSISKNVGALNSHLKVLRNIKDNLFSSNSIFSNLGLTYLGPFDGHNIFSIINMLKKIKDKKGTYLLFNYSV